MNRKDGKLVVYLQYTSNSPTIKIGNLEYNIPLIDLIKEVSRDEWPFTTNDDVVA